MVIAMDKIVSNTDLFFHELQDMYDAEKELVKALDQLQAESMEKDHKQAYQSHLEETKNHVKRLENVFQLLNQKPKSRPCKAIQGIIQEKKDLSKTNATDKLREKYNLLAAMKSEHYEIGTYAWLIALAENMDNRNIKQELERNLQEEKNALKKLEGFNQSDR